MTEFSKRFRRAAPADLRGGVAPEQPTEIDAGASLQEPIASETSVAQEDVDAEPSAAATVDPDDLSPQDALAADSVAVSGRADDAAFGAVDAEAEAEIDETASTERAGRDQPDGPPEPEEIAFDPIEAEAVSESELSEPLAFRRPIALRSLDADDVAALSRMAEAARGPGWRTPDGAVGPVRVRREAFDAATTGWARCDGRLAGAPFAFEAPRAIMAAAAARRLVGVDPLDLSDGAARSAALEAAFADPLDALERATGMDVVLDECAPDGRSASPSDPTTALPLEIAGAPMRLRLDPATRAALLTLWPEPSAPPHGARFAKQLPVRVAVRLGGTDAPVSAIRRLEPGDALTVDPAFAGAAAAVVVAERLAAPAQLDAGRPTLVGRATTARPSRGWECLTMAARDDEDAAAPPFDDGLGASGAFGDAARGALSHADVESLPVRVVVELARTELTVAELAELSVGSPLPLPTPADLRVSLYANGRRFATGVVFEIDGRLGVEIETLSIDR